MSAALAQLPSGFVRRTTLNENEYRVNFKQIDNDVIKALVSPEAKRVTPQMPAIYLNLLLSPQSCWERDGVIHFIGEDREEGHITAWEQMREIAGVANSTLSKALDWMHKSGIIGYDARANGVGVRIFFNRALSSIRPRKPQKNLFVSPAPTFEAPTPSVGMRFKGSSHEINSDDHEIRANARCSSPFPSQDETFGSGPFPSESEITTSGIEQGRVISFAGSGPSPAECGTRPGNDLRGRIAPLIQSTPAQPVASHNTLIATLARQMATEFRSEILTAVKRESAGVREWFLNHGVPKATRIAQRETYNILRSHGVISKKKVDSTTVGISRDQAGQGRAGQRDDCEVAAFIAETSLAIRRRAADFSASDSSALAAACLAAGGRLDDLREQIVAGERLAVGEIEERLTAIDAGITESLWKAAPAAERESTLASARSELRSYAASMERGAFDDLVRRQAISTARQKQGIPDLSLFYL